MSEVDKILQLLASMGIDTGRKGYASGGNLEDKLNVKPVDGGYGEIVVVGSRPSDFDFLDSWGGYGFNNYGNMPNADGGGGGGWTGDYTDVIDGSPPPEEPPAEDEIVVNAPPKTSPDFTTPLDRKSTRLNSSHIPLSRMPSSA